MASKWGYLSRYGEVKVVAAKETADRFGSGIFVELPADFPSFGGNPSRVNDDPETQIFVVVDMAEVLEDSETYVNGNVNSGSKSEIKRYPHVYKLAQDLVELWSKAQK